jgi:hypothetical protein
MTVSFQIRVLNTQRRKFIPKQKPLFRVAHFVYGDANTNPQTINETTLEQKNFGLASVKIAG